MIAAALPSVALLAAGCCEATRPNGLPPLFVLDHKSRPAAEGRKTCGRAAAAEK